MYDDFIEELEQIATQHNKKGMRYFLNSHLSKESIDFLTDAFNGKFKTYTKEDWDRVLKLAETNRGIRQLIPSQSVPKEIFMKFAPKLDDYSNCLRRTDLTETEISNFLKILGAEKVKEMMVEDPSAFSDSVRSYFIHLYPDELKRYDYLPFRLMHRGVQGFDDIENNYDQLYPNNEDAWTEIMNNRFIMEKTKREIFQQGCNIEKLINPPRGEIAHSVYESLAQTIFEFDVDENMGAFKKAEEKLIDLLDKDTLSYSCQMDIIERYKEKPHWAYNRIMKKLALSSKIDEVLAEIAPFCLSSPDINEAVTYNTYSGNDTYKVLVDRARSAQSKKALFIQFLSHKPDGRPLSKDVMKEASDWGDKNLNKYIVLDHHRFLTKPMEGKTGSYDFYFQFALMVRNELKHKPRAEIFTTSLLLCDKEFNLQHIRDNKIVDNEYCFFMNEFDLKNLISTKYGELGCIESHEKEAMDKIIEKCKDVIQGNPLSTKEEKRNQLDTLFGYKTKIEKIWEQEKLRRNFNKLFMEAKLDGSSGAKEAFRFNMYEVVKAPKSEIEALNCHISKLDNKELIEKLKFNLLNDMVESVVKPDASFLLIATHKCYPIYETLNKRLQELSKEVNIEEIEEER